MEKGDGLSVLERNYEVLESRKKLMGSCSLVERRWSLATLEKVDEPLHLWRRISDLQLCIKESLWRKEMELCSLVGNRWNLAILERDYGAFPFERKERGLAALEIDNGAFPSEREERGSCSLGERLWSISVWKKGVWVLRSWKIRECIQS